MTYRGLGSGIRRALAEWDGIDFIDDRQGCTFTVILHQNLKVQNSSGCEPLNDMQIQLLSLIETNPGISYQQLLLILKI